MSRKYVNIKQDTLKAAYNPYDIVTDSYGNVGFIQEVSVNDDQPDPNSQISYAVRWMVGDGKKHAWYSHSDLTAHANIFVEIAKASCHPMGSNVKSVMPLFLNFRNTLLTTITNPL